ncbi:hypothetical protein GY45DRAFT_712923 [Cubamyces sp. BRFM 1775]|nr:hypothetical protein GY45DRAFT_712923 [Cubamyces sp. BRFM 1775]
MGMGMGRCRAGFFRAVRRVDGLAALEFRLVLRVLRGDRTGTKGRGLGLGLGLGLGQAGGQAGSGQAEAEIGSPDSDLGPRARPRMGGASSLAFTLRTQGAVAKQEPGRRARGATLTACSRAGLPTAPPPPPPSCRLVLPTFRSFVRLLFCLSAFISHGLLLVITTSSVYHPHPPSPLLFHPHPCSYSRSHPHPHLPTVP